MPLHQDATANPADPACYQCGNKNPEQGFTTARIICRAWNPNKRNRRGGYGAQDVMEKIVTVCKGTGCGGHAQMAHEG